MADEVLSNSKGLGGPGPSKDPEMAPLLLTPAEPGQERTYLVNNDDTKEPEIWTAAEVDKNQRFNRAMATTPRPLITPILIAINAAIFAAMLASGFSFTNPSAESFLRWGADFGPLTTHGQWWRVVTAAFVHGGFLHLLMNMLILLSIGRFTERLFGRLGFVVLYIFAGIGGNLASLALHPLTVAMGASGAIFGLYGGLLAVLLLHRNSVPRPRIMAIAKSAAIFIAINLLYGLSQSNVDMAAHIGGLVAGFLLGCGLIGPLVPADPDWRQLRILVVALAGTALAVILALRMPIADDWRSNLNRLIALDTKNQRLYSEALRKLQLRQMNAAEFAKLIDTQILPPWNAERESFSKLGLSKQQRAIADQLVEYMSLRAEAWSLMERGVSTSDPAIARRAFQEQAAAEAALRTINREFAPATKPNAGSKVH
jgi:rhomboid protease GluP